MKQLQLMARRRAGLDDPPSGGHHAAQASYTPSQARQPEPNHPHNTMHHSQPPRNKQISLTLNGDGFRHIGSITDTVTAVTCISGPSDGCWL